MTGLGNGATSTQTHLPHSERDPQLPMLMLCCRFRWTPDNWGYSGDTKRHKCGTTLVVFSGAMVKQCLCIRTVGTTLQSEVTFRL